MTFKVISALAGLSVVAALAGSDAHAATYTVDAINSISSWLDTGIDANPATTYDFTVIDPSTTWSAGATASRTSNANGIDPSTLINGTGPGDYGQATMLGFTFNFGALVGEDFERLLPDRNGADKPEWPIWGNPRRLLGHQLP